MTFSPCNPFAKATSSTMTKKKSIIGRCSSALRPKKAIMSTARTPSNSLVSSTDGDESSETRSNGQVTSTLVFGKSFHVPATMPSTHPTAKITCRRKPKLHVSVKCNYREVEDMWYHAVEDATHDLEKQHLEHLAREGISCGVEAYVGVEKCCNNDIIIVPRARRTNGESKEFFPTLETDPVESEWKGEGFLAFENSMAGGLVQVRAIGSGFPIEEIAIPVIIPMTDKEERPVKRLSFFRCVFSRLQLTKKQKFSIEMERSSGRAGLMKAARQISDKKPFNDDISVITCPFDV